MKNFLTLLLLLLPMGMMAQKEGDFTIDAELLSRGELRHGGLSKKATGQDADKAQFVVERARLILGYQRDALSMKVSLQHGGLWGMEGEGSAFNIYEAWAELRSKKGLFARIGRQELRYDDERILGNNDWAMVALSHDVLKVGWENHGHRLHAFAAYNQNEANTKGGTYYKDGAQPYKTMQTVWYHYDAGSLPLGVSLLFMNVGMQSGTEKNYYTTYQQLFGGYVTLKPKNLKLEASYYRQAGKASMVYESRVELPLHSWMGSVKCTYDLNNRLTAYAGFDYLSGDKEFVVPDPGHIGSIQHKEINAFTSVFGSSHKFYGAMDFFYVQAYYDTNSPGLQNLYGGITVKPLKDLSMDASYHYMAMSSDVKGLKKTLGHEVELSASYNLMKDVSLSAGYSLMMGTETMERLQRSTDKRLLRWGWLMVNFTPRIFDYSSK
jgi:hypothetical protein